MLQEIQVKDIKNVHTSAIKEYYFLIYEEIRKNQVELGLADNFYFDDNFYWEELYLNVPNKVKKNMICGEEMYCGVINFKNAKTKIFSIIKQKYSNDYSWARGNFSIEKKMGVVFNKLRPTSNFDKKLREGLSERRTEKEMKKMQFQREEEERKRKQEEEQLKKKTKIATVNNTSVKKNAYIYGIKVDGELVYIGKTYRDLKERISEHIECMLDESINNSQQNYLYKAMRECEIGYKFELLYESHNVISNYELETIEKSLIENIKPKFNYEGVKVPYRFSEDK